MSKLRNKALFEDSSFSAIKLEAQDWLNRTLNNGAQEVDLIMQLKISVIYQRE